MILALSSSKTHAITTCPDPSGAYVLYLPSGIHNVTASGPGYLSQSVFPVNLNVQNPILAQDYYLSWFTPPSGLDFDVEQDSLTLFWNSPQEPPYSVLNYKVFRKLNSGHYEMMAITVDTFYSEKLSILGDYHYYVAACYEQGESVASELVSFSYPYVDANDPIIPPLVSRLHQNYPNPFNPTTTIMFELAQGAEVKLDVYNIKGHWCVVW